MRIEVCVDRYTLWIEDKHVRVFSGGRPIMSEGGRNPPGTKVLVALGRKIVSLQEEIQTLKDEKITLKDEKIRLDRVRGVLND